MSLLFDPLDDALGNRAKVRLLRVLQSAENELSVREAARIAQISHVAALKPLDDLAHMGIVHRKLAGRQHLYRLNRDNLLTGALAALFDAERARADQLFANVADAVDRAAADRLVGAYLIGSAARGQDKPGSDLDLLVLVSDSGITDSVARDIASEAVWLRLELGVSVSPIVLPDSRFRTMARKRDAFALAAIKDGRVIRGPRLENVVRGRA